MRTERAMRITKRNDKVNEMEIKYCRIWIAYNGATDNGEFGEI